MRLGICSSLERADEFLEVGFDYVELPACRFLEGSRSYRAEVTNLFFPGDTRFFGEDRTDWLELGKRTVEAAAQAGAKLMVLGSGGARRAPAVGQEWEDDFVEVAAALDEFAKVHGIRVVPESLNKSETNVGNDLEKLARSLHARGLGYTADAYHVLREEGVSPDWEKQIPFAPAHVHFASYERKVPQPDDRMLEPFFKRLKALGYRGRVSFEGSLEDLTPREALERLRAVASD